MRWPIKISSKKPFKEKKGFTNAGFNQSSFAKNLKVTGQQRQAYLKTELEELKG